MDSSLVALRRTASHAAEQARRTAVRMASDARAAIGADGTTFLSIEAQEAALRRIKEVRILNDVKALEMSVVNNKYGPGVIVSSLGSGTAVRAGLKVGDVIEYINGTKLESHEQAFEVMRACKCRDLAFSVVGSPRKVSIDKTQPGKVEITLGTVTYGVGRKKAPAVEVQSVGLMGLAHSEGISAGDVILAINGSLVEDHQSAILMIDSAEAVIELVVADKEPEEGEGPYELPAGQYIRM